MAINKAYREAEEKIEQARITNATTLDLNSTYHADDSEKLTQLPEAIFQLTQLVSLNLMCNKLTELPKEISHLKSLRTLFVPFNQLTTLPESLDQLDNLATIDIQYNNLTSLPDSLLRLKQLRSLNLSNNNLQSLPDSISQLKNLRSLNASNNELTFIPESLEELNKLNSLSLGNNKIKKLPNSLCQLDELVFCSFTNNQLSALPDCFKKLKRLNYLFLHENDDLGIPKEILGNISHDKQALPSKILDYYFATRDNKGSELRELKLIVVGRGEAGKTSLIRRLNGESLNLAERETHGINITPLNLICHDGPVTARVWDFGGQHVLHAMHEFFLTSRSLYLLVLGEREDMAEHDAAYWLQLIRSYAGNAPVVIAINKNKGKSREMDRDSLERNYGPIVGWVSTECSEGYDATISNLRGELTKAANRMDEVRQLFPSKWWEIKQWLESMQTPYLDFEQYQTKCQELGEGDERNQKRLAGWLNDLGIAINYNDSKRLQNTTVLRPDWLANGIYAVLRANDTKHPSPLAPLATLTLDNLGEIYKGAEEIGMLQAADYPEEMWPFLIELMYLFQLAFPVDELGKKLLIPTLLQLEPPLNCEESKDSKRIRLRYQFNVVPGPLLPKLLVRTFSLISREKIWRRGAILSYGEAQARVWSTQDERWIQITAVGDKDDCQELLTMIRITLKELFYEYQNLKVVEQWEYYGEWVPRRTLEKFGVLESEQHEEDVF